MDTWKKCVLSARKPMSIKFCVLEGGGFGGGGGGKCRFYFYGREDFSDKSPVGNLGGADCNLKIIIPGVC